MGRRLGHVCAFWAPLWLLVDLTAFRKHLTAGGEAMLWSRMPRCPEGVGRLQALIFPCYHLPATLLDI
jgi:hypothetical protein